jgi:hypothetical protein
MEEKRAIELMLMLAEKHIVPPEKVDDRDSIVIQIGADLYKAGYEIVPRKPKDYQLPTSDALEQMRKDGVIY